MILKDLKNNGYPSYGKLLTVYGIYWVEGKEYYFCSPEKYEGLMVYSEDDVEVINNKLHSDYVLTNIGENHRMICHEVLLKNNLLDRLSECEKSAYYEFLIGLKENDLPVNPIDNKDIKLKIHNTVESLEESGDLVITSATPNVVVDRILDELGVNIEDVLDE